MIEWTTIAIAVAGSISIGELISLFTVKEHKKGMKIENEQKEDDRWEKLADQQADQINQLNEQITSLNDRLEKKDVRIIELEDRCADLRNKLDEANTNLAKASLLKCNRLNCTNRRPPLGYTELSADEIIAERNAGNIE